MELGKKIVLLRKLDDMTQIELARRSRISVSYLSKIERGICPDPHIKTLGRIAWSLGVEINELL